jgi:hypothetical protein
VDAREGHAAMAGGSIFTLCALLWLAAMRTRVPHRVYRGCEGDVAEALQQIKWAFCFCFAQWRDGRFG